LAANVYASVAEFLADLDQVFINCRLYNGTDSIVGRIGTQVQTEAEGLIRGLRLRERFGSPEEQSKFMLDAQTGVSQDIDAMNLHNPVQEYQNRNGDSDNEQSEDDIPKHEVPYHNNQIAPRNEGVYNGSPRIQEEEPGEAKNDQIFEEE